MPNLTNNSMTHAEQKEERKKREQVIAQQKRFEEAKQAHDGYAKLLKEQFLGKMILVGISGQGISRTYVTAIEADMTGAVAVALSSNSTAGEDGMYFDMRQLTIYRVYTEEEAKAWEAKWQAEVNKANAEGVRPDIPNAPTVLPLPKAE